MFKTPCKLKKIVSHNLNSMLFKIVLLLPLEVIFFPCLLVISHHNNRALFSRLTLNVFRFGYFILEVGILINQYMSVRNEIIWLFLIISITIFLCAYQSTSGILVWRNYLKLLMYKINRKESVSIRVYNNVNRTLQNDTDPLCKIIYNSKQTSLPCFYPRSD